MKCSTVTDKKDPPRFPHQARRELVASLVWEAYGRGPFPWGPDWPHDRPPAADPGLSHYWPLGVPDIPREGPGPHEVPDGWEETLTPEERRRWSWWDRVCLDADVKGLA